MPVKVEKGDHPDSWFILDVNGEDDNWVWLSDADMKDLAKRLRELGF